MRRVLVLILAGVTALAPAAFANASLSPSKRPVIESFSVNRTRVPAAGGVVLLRAKVEYATTCTFGGAGTVTVRCAAGHAAATDTLVANTTATVRTARLWVQAHGKGGASVRRYITLTESPAPTKCTGPCKFHFPQPTDEGVASVTLNSVAQGVTCPDPGLCDASVGQQIDDLNVTVCAATQGINDTSFEVEQFSLALSDGTQASLDSVTFDNNVQSAFGNYRATAPDQCVTGNIYLDTPGGSQWTSVNYAYQSGLTQFVYVWSN
jgi:hypothetical protein